MALFTGEYTLRIDVSQVSCYLIFRCRALPGISLCDMICCGFISALFRMKAMPAFDVGVVGSSDTMTSIFLLKHSLICLVIS